MRIPLRGACVPDLRRIVCAASAVLVAPPTLRETGAAEAEVPFAGSTFQGGEPLTARCIFAWFNYQTVGLGRRW